MSGIAKKTIDADGIHTVAQVLAKFNELNTLLPSVGLAQWLPFNQAYAIVTQTIDTGAQQGYFENPDFVAQFSVCFASYYFRAIRNQIGDRADGVEAWQTLSKPRSNHPATAVMMGANAHINHDLPLTLAEMLPESSTQGLLKDIRKVDRLLVRSGPLIVIQIDGGKLGSLCYRPAIYVILLWRVAAWRNYKRITRGKPGKQQARSTKIANRLLWLDRLFVG